ncbi:MAG TPA: hypothetical protein VLA56_11355 [Pseudomonadales bacterium]|nr:hypothetical protein [Pseudomonadales bacterium]
MLIALHADNCNDQRLAEAARAEIDRLPGRTDDAGATLPRG